MIEDIFIRNIEEKDIEEVVDIQISGWKEAYRGIIDEEYLKNMNREERIKKRKKDYKENSFIVATYHNIIVGFCRYINNNKFSSNILNIDCELLSIYVKPEFKFKGIGSKMFEFAINDLKKESKQQMILWCLKDNIKSRKFYEKMGGEVIAKKEIKIGEKYYSEVAYRFFI